MADSARHSVSVAGVIMQEDRVLLVQRRDNGRWEPPGGVLELDETIETGLRREVLEETGVEVDVLGLSGVYKNLARGIVALVFRCAPRSGTPLAETTEALAVRWFPVAEVGAVLAETYAVRVTDALASGVAVRDHDGVHVLSTTPG